MRPASLSIHIPTFKRPDRVVAQLVALMPQLGDDIHVTIHGNGDDSELQRCIEPYLSENVTYAEVSHNRGMSANIIKCAESATTEWVWILGDDDTAHPNAVERIKSWIDGTQCDMVSTRAFSNEDHRLQVAASLSELFRATTYSELLFLSGGVYRTALLQHNIEAMFDGALAISPHTAAVLKAVDDGRCKVLVVGAHLVTHKAGKTRWSRVAYLERTTTLLYIVRSRKELAKAMWQNWQWAAADSLREIRNEKEFVEWRRACLKSVQAFSDVMHPMMWCGSIAKSAALAALGARDWRTDWRQLLITPPSRAMHAIESYLACRARQRK